MDLTFQVPMQYCSLQYSILLLSLVTFTTGYCFCFGSIPSFFLELFLHWPPVAYWAPTDLGSTSFSILPFCLFIPFMGFLRQEYWSGFPFPSPVDHILSDLSTMNHPSWVAPQAWLGFIELDKAVVLVWLDWLVFCEYDFSVSALWCPLATPTILLGFLLPWAWGILSDSFSQSTLRISCVPWMLKEIVSQRTRTHLRKSGQEASQPQSPSETSNSNSPSMEQLSIFLNLTHPFLKSLPFPPAQPPASPSWYMAVPSPSS